MKRRQFIKTMTATAPAAYLSTSLGMGSALMTDESARAADASGRNKVIFISDIHMNVDAPYSWLINHVQPLTAFLEALNTRTDVAELVIIGDLLDDWVSPVETPSPTFAMIFQAGINQPPIQALKAICMNPDIKVTYLTGNHDLLSFEQANKAVIQATFPTMTIISDAPGLGAYSKDNVIWAEHGHRYTLFNAPDTWSRPGGNLPLGYFISRLAASASVKNGAVVTTPELLDQFVKQPTANLKGTLRSKGWPKRPRSKADTGAYDDAFILLVYSAIAAYSGYLPWDDYSMNGLDGFTKNPTVAKIGLTYDRIYSKWGSRQDIVGALNAVVGDIGALGPAANLLFEMPAYIKAKYPFTPRIILFGHTHEPVFEHHMGSDDTIYINTGTWIDSKPLMTYAEIECQYGVNGNNLYTAALWAYGETTARFSGTITVPA